LQHNLRSSVDAVIFGKKCHVSPASLCYSQSVDRYFHSAGCQEPIIFLLTFSRIGLKINQHNPIG